MIRFFLLILFAICSFYSYSQQDQVITLQGDTLIGKASYSTISNQGQTITLKNGKEKTRFKVYEISSLVKGENVYHTIKISGQYQLGLLKKEGYLSLYWFMDQQSSTPQEFSGSVLIKVGGTQLIVPNLRFKKQVENFLMDCNTVKTSFEKDLYKKSDLDKIIDDYNNCINKNTAKLIKENINHNPTKTEQITALSKDIKDNGPFPDMENVLEMLNDLSIKIKDGAKIPAYLKSALRTSLKSNTAYVNMLNQILLTER